MKEKNVHQYVSCPTSQSLDLCYGSIEHAYKVFSLPPICSSDHKCVDLVPTYKSMLKTEKVETRDNKTWSEESVLCLKECLVAQIGMFLLCVSPHTWLSVGT